jgi:hypothetical protein
MSGSTEKPDRSGRLRAAILWLSCMLAAIICVLTLGQAMPSSAPGGFDKLYHFIAFAGLVLPAALFDRRDLTWIAIAAFFLGLGIEILQPYVGRSREWADLAADAGGIVFAVLVGRAWQRKRQDRHR